jgi:hypothetical protein
MPLVGFEPTIPVFERAKTFHALDCAATVIGTMYANTTKLCRRQAEVILNHRNPNIRAIKQEAMHRKYKRLKFGDDLANDRSSI